LKRYIILLAAMAACLVTSGAGAADTSGRPTVTLTMTGSSIAVAGTLQSGAVDVTSTVTGEKSASPILIRLDAGVTPDQLLAVLGSPAGENPDNVEGLGRIVFGSDVPAGTSTVQTVLPAGQYVALDAAGPDPSKAPRTTFTVAAAAHPASLPAAQATVRAIDFGFKGPRTLHVGQVVRAQNDGFVVHMIDAVAVRNAKDAKKVTKLLRDGKDHQAEKLVKGDTSLLGVVSHGAVLQQTLNAKPGYYVLACFMATQDGREHTRLGMVRELRIVR
jgi:hypothetical protein